VLVPILCIINPVKSNLSCSSPVSERTSLLFECPDAWPVRPCVKAALKVLYSEISDIYWGYQTAHKHTEWA
jgi:hypothetical protein